MILADDKRSHIAKLLLELDLRNLACSSLLHRADLKAEAIVRGPSAAQMKPFRARLAFCASSIVCPADEAGLFQRFQHICVVTTGIAYMFMFDGLNSTDAFHPIQSLSIVEKELVMPYSAKEVCEAENVTLSAGFTYKQL